MTEEYTIVQLKRQEELTRRIEDRRQPWLILHTVPELVRNARTRWHAAVRMRTSAIMITCGLNGSLVLPG
jgi:hypothetical protein